MLRAEKNTLSERPREEDRQRSLALLKVNPFISAADARLLLLLSVELFLVVAQFLLRVLRPGLLRRHLPRQLSVFIRSSISPGRVTSKRVTRI